MAIKSIVVNVANCQTTYRVGELFIQEYPDYGNVKSIVRSSSGFTVRSDSNGSTFYAPHYVEPGSVEEGDD